MDQKTNTLVIAVEDLKVFGIIPAKWLLNFKPFNLEKLINLPPNQHLMVRGNLMMVKPFGLFPPPHIDGKISTVHVMSKWIELEFSGKDPAFSNIPQSGASNFIYLQGGNAQFGKIGMLGAQVQVIDKNPKNLFQFSLLNYLSYLPHSDVQLTDMGGAVLVMPDHEKIPSMASSQDDDADDTGSVPDGKSSKELGFWGNLRAKFKDWFGI